MIVKSMTDQLVSMRRNMLVHTPSPAMSEFVEPTSLHAISSSVSSELNNEDVNL